MGSALLGAKMSERSWAVFFCSGRSTGTSFEVWASTTASGAASPLEEFVLGSCEWPSRTRPPATNPARKTTAEAIHLHMGTPPVVGLDAQMPQGPLPLHDQETVLTVS